MALAVTGVLDDVILVWSRSKEARFDERENPEISIHMCKLFATHDFLTLLTSTEKLLTRTFGNYQWSPQLYQLSYRVTGSRCAHVIQFKCTRYSPDYITLSVKIYRIILGETRKNVLIYMFKKL